MATQNDASNTSEALEVIANGSGEEANGTNGVNGHDHSDHIFTVLLKLPHEPFETKIQVSTQEQVQDVRQIIVDQPFALQYSCFHLEHNGKPINDFIELSEVEGLGPDSVFTLVEDPYTEKEARVHIIRVRELIQAAGEKMDVATGFHAGASLHDTVNGVYGEDSADENDLSEHKVDSPAWFASKIVVPQDIPSPKTVKSISLSPWNPPPAYLRHKGHLLYLIVVNLEGEQFHITSHVSGFYVNRSSHNKFDPSPKQGPQTSSAHSLLTLLQQIDTRFKDAFQELLEHNSKREPLALFALTNALPANPWLVAQECTSLQEHKADITRTQESFLIAGTDNNDNLRDWNEEFQTTRELPVETVPEKVFRERLTSKLFADFNEAAVRGAVLVARGEVPPLNPTEGVDAQIFVHNNVFFSFGADGVGTFATEGGDEAARVATGKDVSGVQLVNQLDIPGLFTAGSIIVDYLGKRIVGQSIVPGIFRQKEPDENQIDYGGVEGKDVVAENETFIKPFAQLSKGTFVKKHPVWDKEGKRFDLEASVDTKGLLGTDGRKYVLDLYRLTPLDITWIEKHWSATEEEKTGSEKKDYPHRMAILRPELIHAYRMKKLHESIEENMPSKAIKKEESEKDTSITSDESSDGDEKAVAKKSEDEAADAEATQKKQQEIVDSFEFSLNPDVFAGQMPQTDEEKAQMDKDEADVRAVCEYLTGSVIPQLVQQLQEGDVGFPYDGESLTSLLHKRGINVRYLGTFAEQCANQEHPRLVALQSLLVQEMVARAFKHIACKYMSHLPPVFSTSAISHLLNCLLGDKFNQTPTVEIDESLRSLYGNSKYDFESVTPESLREEIVDGIRKRYRYTVTSDIVYAGREMQMLREIALKSGLQLVAKDFAFIKGSVQEVNGDAHPITNGHSKKKKKGNASPHRAEAKATPQTFHPEDIVNFVPVVKGAAPKSQLAEEAFEGGRVSLSQDQKEIGHELLLESLTLHEQIYGILHPEVARMYLNMSNIYYQLDEKAGAAELARKAVVIAERTLGLDASETILAYLNLALFEHGCGRSRLGLKYLLHAMGLCQVAYGPNHPDSITILNNGAVMLQSLRRYHESRIWFEKSVSLADQVSGKASVNSATLLFQLAQALALDKDHRASVNRMRESCQLFRTLLGPDDRNTKEAENWLEQLTQSAVNVEKRAKDIASGKIKSRVNMGARPMPGAGQTRGEANGNTTVGSTAGGSGVDKRSIDELLRYINGGDAKKNVEGNGSGSKKRGNPKRRGGANVAVKS
ncbi:hypothetical protein BT63DRAFT_402303 [Microthyrium microscopicum]|uniref:Clustered mitochondria protein homolog n=1 Tax=Microthyrium microscopicum TaxID=703497 RepID=A0A6A6UBD6_9PEZI|nr:hypothetical protein BT63DRAFT_402303 [Microthyrium microscopicum]